MGMKPPTNLPRRGIVDTNRGILDNDSSNSGGNMSDIEIESEIKSKGLTAPRVTQHRIEEVIDGEYYFTAAQGVQAAFGEQDELTRLTGAHGELSLLTFCVLRLKNGLTVTGESACASPDNFDADIGRKIARQNAVNKIWPLEGYLLKNKIHEGQA
jgi:hypothetical protein